jgi:hypothetical protein
MTTTDPTIPIPAQPVTPIPKAAPREPENDESPDFTLDSDEAGLDQGVLS